MFFDPDRDWPRRPREEPPPRPAAARRDEDLILALVVAGLLGLFVAPIAGGTLWAPLVALFGG